MIADFVRGITWLSIGLCGNYLRVFCLNKGQRVLTKYFNVFNKTIKYLKCLFSCCVQEKKKTICLFQLLNCLKYHSQMSFPILVVTISKL